MYKEENKNEDTFNFEKQLMLPLQDSQKVVNRQQLKELILKFQDDKQKGYYTFKNWGKLHGELFGIEIQPLPQTILNLWRVLKLINFGDDYIPTGLIYDTLVTLMLMASEMKNEAQKNKVIQQVEGLLRSIFFKFIEFNGKYLSQQQKQQLAFFKVIRPVAEGYRKIIVSNFQNNRDNDDKQFNKMSRNEQLYKMHDVFVYKKNLQKLKKIEEEFKQCTFQPDLSYDTRATAESRYMEPSRIRKPNNFASSHLIKDPDYIIPQEQYEEQKQFKANPVPNYPDINPIFGVNEHLQRMQRSREIKKINELRVYSSGNSSGSKAVKQFNIEQRNKQRKEKMLSGYKILFNIKVQVSKRIYRVKVRQNMGISDVVRAIQLMVGFKHPDVEQIVKGYFINWEMKKNRKKNPAIKEFSYEEQEN